MGGGGGNLPHDIPDWKIYKVEGVPELERLQKRLGALGLKDPWIRNEAWRFQPVNGGNTHWTRVAVTRTFRGLGLAALAMVLTVAYDKATSKGGDGHGHH